MKKIIPLLLIVLFVSQLSQGQSLNVTETDSLVNLAIGQSEESLYDANFEVAKEIVSISAFQKLPAFNKAHEILLTIQDIRVTSFMNLIYARKTDHSENFTRLKNLLPHAQQLKSVSVQAKYFQTYAGAHRSMGNSDSAKVYSDKAVILFEYLKDNIELANIRAGSISRLHNRLLRDGKKNEILALIPEYQKEIEYSVLHSKYALAYNTRHLAQMHRRQTLNYEASLELFKTSLKLREEIGFKPFIPASHSSLGDVYCKMGQLQSAIDAYTTSLELAAEIGFIRYQVFPLISIGDCLLDQNESEKAMEYYQKALKIAETKNYAQGIAAAINKIKELQN